ncbi:hypothetical protein M422DRAFT_270044, partial [Sphaerobolus stellatus SS14]
MRYLRSTTNTVKRRDADFGFHQPQVQRRIVPTVQTNPTMQAIRLQKKYPQVTQEEMMDLINRFNSIDTDTPGRVAKPAVISALQASGESYDLVRETLKDVSVDASGKVELEDYVELVT